MGFRQLIHNQMPRLTDTKTQIIYSPNSKRVLLDIDMMDMTEDRAEELVGMFEDMFPCLKHIGKPCSPETCSSCTKKKLKTKPTRAHSD